ncbi:MAG: hypothetical protein AB1600_08690, partial [Bacteroidota bacterium]
MRKNTRSFHVKILFVSIFGLFNVLMSQGVVHLQFSVGDGVDYIVIDPFGRKTGLDPRVSEMINNEIPNAGYSVINYGDDEWFNQFTMRLISPQDDGVYLVKLVGRWLSSFSFYFTAEPEKITSPSIGKEIKSFLDKDAEMTYKFTYNGTSSTATKVEKVITITSLGQDITTGGKLNLVGNQTFVNSLNTKCSQMVNFYNAGNKAQAHNKLNEIKSNIQSAYNTPTGTQFVNEYAYNV